MPAFLNRRKEHDTRDSDTRQQACHKSPGVIACGYLREPLPVQSQVNDPEDQHGIADPEMEIAPLMPTHSPERKATAARTPRGQTECEQQPRRDEHTRAEVKPEVKDPARIYTQWTPSRWRGG